MNIINGIIRGFWYLYEDLYFKIIYWDFKLSNIFLDDEMNFKIFDFGIVRIFDCK